MAKKIIHGWVSVIKADNGKDAMRWAKNEQPDLVLLDIMMPDMTEQKSVKF